MKALLGTFEIQNEPHSWLSVEEEEGENDREEMISTRKDQ